MVALTSSRSAAEAAVPDRTTVLLRLADHTLADRLRLVVREGVTISIVPERPYRWDVTGRMGDVATTEGRP